LLFVSLTSACGSDATGPGYPVPPPGPHFTVLPLPMDSLARITPIGFNNKRFPTPHTYWMLCDDFVILQSNRPCRQQRLDVRAPMDATVIDVDASADGFIRFEGVPGLAFHFGHVTPAAGLARGSRVTAGQVVATMFQTNGIDFGLHNNRVDHTYIVPSRYHWDYLHGEHPIAQYAEPLRSQLLAKVNSLSASTLGRYSYDVAGTASGGWFLEGAPPTALMVGNERYLLWLARYVERDETRIASFGETWPGMANFLNAVDDAAPDWETITPAVGAVPIKLWNIGADARPNLAWPAGTMLIQMLDPGRLRVEWFNTHDPVLAFTTSAKVFTR
jgi:hypothetical protein